MATIHEVQKKVLRLEMKMKVLRQDQLMCFIVAVPFIWSDNPGNRYHTRSDNVSYWTLWELTHG